MKVLDVGSGAGDVAIAAAHVVGAEGRVVGVDVNERVLETARTRTRRAGHRNVEFVAGDARTLELGSDFDAVVGRLVLIFMADPAAALRKLITHLRPGGIVAFQEVDATLFDGLAHSDTPLANQLMEWIRDTFRRSGVHVGLGRELPGTFAAAGLAVPEAHLDIPVGAGADWIGFEYLTHLVGSLAPRIESEGVATMEQIGLETLSARLRREADACGRLIALPPHVTAWTKLPE